MKGLQKTFTSPLRRGKEEERKRKKKGRGRRREKEEEKSSLRGGAEGKELLQRSPVGFWGPNETITILIQFSI